MIFGVPQPARVPSLLLPLHSLSSALPPCHCAAASCTFIEQLKSFSALTGTNLLYLSYCELNTSSIVKMYTFLSRFMQNIFVTIGIIRTKQKLLRSTSQKVFFFLIKASKKWWQSKTSAWCWTFSQNMNTAGLIAIAAKQKLFLSHWVTLKPAVHLKSSKSKTWTQPIADNNCDGELFPITIPFYTV